MEETHGFSDSDPSNHLGPGTDCESGPVLLRSDGSGPGAVLVTTGQICRWEGPMVLTARRRLEEERG